MKRIKLLFLPGLLILACTFVAGVKYGKIVSVATPAKETIVYVTTTPTPEKPIVMYEYLHEGCGVSFLLPSSLKDKKESTQSAQIGNYKENNIEISCDKDQNILSSDGKTQVMEFANKKVSVRRTINGLNVFSIQHPQNKKTIVFRISDNVLELITKTLTFIE